MQDHSPVPSRASDDSFHGGARHLARLTELATTALRNYELRGEVSARLVNLSENATFRIDTADSGSYALRIHRHGYHSRAAIASELAWLIDLRQSGAAVTPRPVAGHDGEFIQQVEDDLAGQPRHVVLTEWEQGAEPAIGENLSRPFEILGEVAARMHEHARGWRRPSWFTRFTWDFETSLGAERPHWGRWRDGMGVGPREALLFGRAVAVIGRRLAAYGKSPSRFGLAHCDLRLANLLIDGATVKVLDFDDCGFGWYMYDAATPVSFYEHDAKVPELIEAWKAGYRRVLPLERGDEAEIPTFVMLRRLLLVAWIGSHRETDLAREMGLNFTAGTEGLCEAYLGRFG